MVLPISAAVLMLVIVILLVCALLGFYLASTSIAQPIHTLSTNVAGMISGIRL
jgi:hypothetical protein